MTFAAVGSPFVDANSTFSLTPHGVGNLTRVRWIDGEGWTWDRLSDHWWGMDLI